MAICWSSSAALRRSYTMRSCAACMSTTTRPCGFCARRGKAGGGGGGGAGGGGGGGGGGGWEGARFPHLLLPTFHSPIAFPTADKRLLVLQHPAAWFAASEYMMQAAVPLERGHLARLPEQRALVAAYGK